MQLASMGRRIGLQSNLRTLCRRQFQVCGTLGLTRNTDAPSPPPPHVGQWAEAARCFAQTDVDAFSALTHDHNALHAADGRSSFSYPIVHGLLAASLFPSAFAAAFPGAVYRSQILTFRNAIPVGEHVTGRVTVERVRLLRDGRGGRSIIVRLAAFF